MKFWDGGLNESFLVVGQVSESVVHFDSVSTEGQLGGKVGGVGDLGFNVSVFDNVLAALGGQTVVGESGGGESHREGSTSGSGLGFNNLGTGILNPGGQSFGGLGIETHAWGGLTDDWDDGDSGVATDDWNILVGNVVSGFFGDESLGSNNIQSGDSEDFVWVVDSELFVDLSGDWDGGVDWVGDDSDPGVWTVGGAGFGEVGNDGGIGVEEIVSGHTWFPWDTGWDDNQINILQAFTDLVVTFETADVGWSVAVSEIGSYTWSALDIEQSEVVDIWVSFQKEGKWLTNSSGGTENGDISGGSGSLFKGSADHIAEFKGRVSVSST